MQVTCTLFTGCPCKEGIFMGYTYELGIQCPLIRHHKERVPYFTI